MTTSRDVQVEPEVRTVCGAHVDRGDQPVTVNGWYVHLFRWVNNGWVHTVSPADVRREKHQKEESTW